MITSIQDIVAIYGDKKERKLWNVDCLHPKTHVSGDIGRIYIISCEDCPAQWNEDAYEKMREVTTNG